MSLELISVSAYWNKRSAIRGFGDDHPVSLRAGTGEWVYLAGVNGVGKSTLLNAVAGFTTFVSGEIRLDGFRLRHKDFEDRFGLGISIVPQHPFFRQEGSRIDAELAIEAFRPGLYNEKAISKLVEKIEACGAVKENGFSGRGFDLICALMTAPRLLLLDEIAASICHEGRAVEFYKVIKELLPWSIVAFTEHDVESAISIADRVLWLRSEKKPLDFRRDQRDKVAEVVEELGPEQEVAAEQTSEGMEASSSSIMRLNRSPREQFQLALRASRLVKSAFTFYGTDFRDFVAEVERDFPFLANDLPAERLSGGQRTVLAGLLLELPQLGRLSEGRIRHLDHSNRRRFRRWRKRLGNLEEQDG